jgi:hypothetical protein
MVPRSKRYLAYGAGVFSDALAASLSAIGLWAHGRGWMTLPSIVQTALELIILIAVAGCIWQANVFLRTDGYFVLANALRCRNLAGDAKAFLRTRAAGYPRVVRIYALGYAVTVVVLSIAWLLALTVAVRAAVAGVAATRIGIIATVVLLGAAVAAQRRRDATAYRLVYPAGLLLVLACSPAAAL